LSSDRRVVQIYTKRLKFESFVTWHAWTEVIKNNQLSKGMLEIRVTMLVG